MAKQINPRAFLGAIPESPRVAMRREAIAGRSNLPGQLELPQTGADPAGLAKKKAAAPLLSDKPQKPCDVGLFSDSAAQIDLLDQIKR